MTPSKFIVVKVDTNLVIRHTHVIINSYTVEDSFEQCQCRFAFLFRTGSCENNFE